MRKAHWKGIVWETAKLTAGGAVIAATAWQMLHWLPVWVPTVNALYTSTESLTIRGLLLAATVGYIPASGAALWVSAKLAGKIRATRPLACFH